MSWWTSGYQRPASTGTRYPTGADRAGSADTILGYWDGGQWWGAGPGAHSFVGTTRWWNVKHPNPYAQILSDRALPVAGFEQLDGATRHTEDVLLRIRLRQGLPTELLDEAERQRAGVAVEDGLLTREGERLVLTNRGRLLADGVVRNLLG